MDFISMFKRGVATDPDACLFYFITHGFKTNPEYYSCDNKTVEEWYATGEPNPILGSYFLVSGLVLICLYIPCLIAIIRSDLIKTSCYKIMTWLGILDITALLINSVATGYFGIMGAVYCTNPLTIHVLGGIGVGGWIGSCSTCILLALNRCCDLNDRIPLRVIFEGKRIWFTLAAPITITMGMILFIKPGAFNSIYMTWFINPMNGEVADKFINIEHAINNCIVSFCTTSLYAYLCLLIFLKSRNMQSTALSKTQKQVFIQSILICSFNAIAAYIYVYMQFLPSPKFLILVGQVAWQYSSGSTGIVYLTMNKRIRKDVLKLLMLSSMRKKLGKVNAITINSNSNGETQKKSKNGPSSRIL